MSNAQRDENLKKYLQNGKYNPYLSNKICSERKLISGRKPEKLQLTELQKVFWKKLDGFNLNPIFI